MSLNCTQLVADSMETLSNNGSVLWLENDETEPSKNFLNWTDPALLLLLISIFTILLILNLLTSYYYIYYDKQQQKIALNSHSSVQDTVRPYLEAYDLSTEVVNIIFEFADIEPHRLVIESKWKHPWKETENATVSTKQIIRTRFMLNLMLIIFATMYCAPTYACILHWKDSYRSYVEMECIVHFDLNKLVKKEHYLYEFDVRDLCMNDSQIINDYIFYGSIPYMKEIKKHSIPSCYIHTQKFTVRGKSECCGCDCSRCGVTPKECNRRSTNAYGYCVYFCVSLMTCMCGTGIVCRWTKADIKKYTVSVSVHNPSVMLHCL